ncbi:MAG: hypothetical protein ABF420_08950 [Acetobacter syzygii]|uniref:hypothetical protein n=1 Tax=Acetobacter syzygii TaxID=146476 RepID=UPI0039EBB092
MGATLPEAAVPVGPPDAGNGIDARAWALSDTSDGDKNGLGRSGTSYCAELCGVAPNATAEHPVSNTQLATPEALTDQITREQNLNTNGLSLNRLERTALPWTTP